MITEDLTDRIRDIIDDKIILITGGTGSLGYVLTKRLAEDYNPREIRLLCRSVRSTEETQYYLGQKLGKDRVRDLLQFPYGDVADRGTLVEPLRGAQIVFHLASIKDVGECEKNRDEAHRVNVKGSHNVIEEVLERGEAECVLGASTDKACNPGNQVYGKTKREMEKLFIAGQSTAKALRKEVKFSLIRGGNFLGSRRSVIDKWLRAIKYNESIEVTDGRMRRFTILLSEAVDLYLWVLVNGKGGEIVSREMPSYKLDDLVRAFCEIQGIGEERIRWVGKGSGERANEYLIDTISDEMAYTRAEEGYDDMAPYIEGNRPFRIFVLTQGKAPNQPVDLVPDTTEDSFLLKPSELKNILSLAFDELPWLKI